jgi:hypothetical protein
MSAPLDNSAASSSTASRLASRTFLQLREAALLAAVRHDWEPSELFEALRHINPRGLSVSLNQVQDYLSDRSQTRTKAWLDDEP